VVLIVALPRRGLSLAVATTRNPRYVAVLALVAALILTAGWFGRPRDIPEAPAPVPSETELEQLARRTERRSLEATTRHFERVSREGAVSIARIPSRGVSGIVWDEQRVVVPTLDEPPSSGAVPVALGSTVGRASLGVWGPNLPVATLQFVESGNRTPVRRAVGPPPVGGWVVAAWRTDAGSAFAAGNFQQQAPMICADLPVEQISTSVALHPAMLGGGLFDLEGHLLGIIAHCRGQLAVVAAAAVDPIIARDTAEQRLLGTYGIVVGPLSPEEQAYFRTEEGLLVREVWTDLHGDVAGLQPGDIVLKVNGQPVTSPGELAVPAASGSPVNLMVRRRRTTVPIQLQAGSDAASSDAVGGEGVKWQSLPRTFTIDAVRPGSREHRAGLQPGDELLRLDQVEPQTLDHVRRRLRAPAPVLIEVLRDRRHVAILVQ
jgi:S1-C subfamily serine protease